MASSEKFCLRWNDFEANVSGAFREIREEKDFFDVTLACDDNQMEAHKVIISACSPWFRNILRRNPHQHPLLYLKGVKYRELVAVLNFMYQGEVNVAQDDLNSFLSVAEELQVKGLTQGGSGSGNNQSKSSSSASKPEPKANPSTPSVRNVPEIKKPRVVSQAPAVLDDDDIQEVVPVKSEPGAGSSMAMEQAHAQYLGGDQGAVALEDSYQDEAYDYEGYDDGSAGVIDPNTGLPYAGSDGNKDIFPDVLLTLSNSESHLSNNESRDRMKSNEDDEIKSKMRKMGQMWECLECDYKSNKNTNVIRHIESKHTTSLYTCQLCGIVLRGSNAYSGHMYRKHKPQPTQLQL